MLQLGNDIVDIARDGAVHPRFVDRILHPEERRLYPRIAESAKDVWALWSAKEAAFKAYRQLHPGFLKPSRWLVKWAEKRVEHGHQSWLLESFSGADYVASVCASESARHETIIESFAHDPTPHELSAKGREILAQLLRKQGFDSSLVKDAGGVPRLISAAGAPAFSISHHARMVMVSVEIKAAPY